MDNFIFDEHEAFRLSFRRIFEQQSLRCSTVENTTSAFDQARIYQLEQIKRKYGMFIHFGINTFYDQEWTDGSKPAASYKPLTVDADQWISTARDAGMKYVILVTKHVDGFCLWDSKHQL